MKLLELRPPIAVLIHSAPSCKYALKPSPQPDLSVTVESPTNTIFTLCCKAGDSPPIEASEPVAKSNVVNNAVSNLDRIADANE